MRKIILIAAIMLLAVPVMAADKVKVPVGNITVTIVYKDIPLSEVAHMMVLAQEHFKTADIQINVVPVSGHGL